MVKITFLDNSELHIKADTVLNGYKRSDKVGAEYYLTNVFTDSIDGKFSKEGSLVATVNPKVGISGFLLSVDCFSVGLDTENNVLYFSSAVKSVENLTVL
ncbi:hypothetical protein [Paenibacillus apiarius]|uniref:hypothetical protein n=1 Tax=Paenibacillus apiarius TaxID=46240 RepID=UPI003B3B81E4